MDSLIQWKNLIFGKLETIGDWGALLPIRLLMAYEFGTAGMMKFNGQNWFGRFQENFLFPFNVIPPEISWFMATWAEILGGLCLFLGLFTRFWAFSLIVVSIVAISGVHWPSEWSGLSGLWESYTITKASPEHGNFRVPLLFMVMLVPLVLRGAGILSLDNVLNKKFS